MYNIKNYLIPILYSFLLTFYPTSSPIWGSCFAWKSCAPKQEKRWAESRFAWKLCATKQRAEVIIVLRGSRSLLSRNKMLFFQTFYENNFLTNYEWRLKMKVAQDHDLDNIRLRSSAVASLFYSFIEYFFVALCCKVQFAWQFFYISIEYV